MKKISSNQHKHETKNPLRRVLLNRYNLTLKDLVARQVGLGSKHEAIFDAGCGEGFVLEYLSQQFEFPTIIGADISPEAVEEAKSRVSNAKFMVANLASQDFSKDIANLGQSEFDIVLCLEVLEHIPDYSQALENLNKIPARNFIISVPNEPFFRLSNLIALKNVKRLGNDIEHVNNWSTSRFKKILQNYFTIVSCMYPFPWQMYLCQKKN